MSFSASNGPVTSGSPDSILQVQTVVSATVSPQEHGGSHALGLVTPFCFGGCDSQPVRLEMEGTRCPQWAAMRPSLENDLFKPCFEELRDGGRTPFLRVRRGSFKPFL